MAEKAGVSIATVSLVLNGSKSISGPVQDRVMKAARQLNYQPNRLARALRGKGSTLIAYVIPTVTNPVFAHVARGVQDLASNENYSVIICNTDFDFARMRQYFNLFTELNVDGVIISARHGEQTNALIASLQAQRIPVVISHAPTNVRTVDAVIADDEQGSFDATRHLIELGHVRIGVIGVRHSHTAKTRLRGFRRAHHVAGLTVDEDLVCEEESWTEESGSKGLLRLEDNPRMPTAVFALSDLIGIGVVKRAMKMKIDIPRDLTVIGFDDTLAHLAQPELTSVTIPHYDIGRQAAQLLLERIEQMRTSGPSASTTTKKLGAKLTIRQSSAPPRDGESGEQPMAQAEGGS